MTGEARAGTLHHLEFYVADLAAAVAFWRWLLARLGYEEYQSWPGGRSWRLGETYLVFVQSEERFSGIPYHRCRPGLNHLAFHAGPRRQVDELTEEARRRGARILYEDRHPFAGGPDHYAVFLEDPQRIKVELVASG